MHHNDEAKPIKNEILKRSLYICIQTLDLVLGEINFCSNASWVLGKKSHKLGMLFFSDFPSYVDRISKAQRGLTGSTGAKTFSSVSWDAPSGPGPDFGWLSQTAAAFLW